MVLNFKLKSLFKYMCNCVVCCFEDFLQLKDSWPQYKFGLNTQRVLVRLVVHVYKNVISFDLRSHYFKRLIVLHLFIYCFYYDYYFLRCCTV